MFVELPGVFGKTFTILELTWKWTMAAWKTIFLYKQGAFHCHVSSTECKFSSMEDVRSTLPSWFQTGRCGHSPVPKLAQLDCLEKHHGNQTSWKRRENPPKPWSTCRNHPRIHWVRGVSALTTCRNLRPSHFGASSCSDAGHGLLR